MRPFLTTLAAFATCLMLSPAAQAACVGDNLVAALSPADAAAVDAATLAHPFPAGNLWRATRNGATVTLLGTYHFADPRHATIMATTSPLISAARTLLVEAGPEEEQQLMEAMASNPDLMFLSEGGSLLERMPPADWDALATAMQARGMPPFMTAKLQPWYVALTLAIPACDAEAMLDRNGLDQLVMDVATESGLPIRALEPYDTIFGLFATMPVDDQISMIRSTLAFEEMGLSESLSVTLAELYFAQDARRMWEFMRLASHRLPGYTPETADAEFARMEDLLMTQRNRAWIPVIEQATADGPVFVAFGALHLAGENGVLNLLEQAGFTLERLPL